MTFVDVLTVICMLRPVTGNMICLTCSVKDEHAGVVEVEMGLDALRLDVVASVLRKSSGNSRCTIRGEI